jgi:uncharacterized Zn finger protein (UPF0148 family)
MAGKDSIFGTRQKHNMRIKLDKKCPACGMYLVFVEQEDGVYVMCERCRVAVYTPTETAAEYATDFSTLIELMAEELSGMAKRKVKQKREDVWRGRFG